MKTIALVLMALGVLALIYGGIDYNKHSTVFQMGSMEVATSEHHSIPIPAIAGVIVLVGGFALFFAGNRRSGRT